MMTCELIDALQTLKREIVQEVVEAIEGRRTKQLEFDTRELKTMDEACEFFETSRQTIYIWIKDLNLPSIKKGKQRFFLESDLKVFKMKHRRRPQ